MSPSTTSPGGTVTYHVTVSKPGATVATVTSITDTLPAGFSYQGGTTTGVTTTDPTVTGNQLVWSGSWNVPGASGGTPGTITLDFQATASTTPGTYRNTVTADGPGLTVVPAIDVAPVTVEGTTPTDPPPPPPTLPTIPTSTSSSTTTVPDSSTTAPPSGTSGTSTGSTPLARTGGEQGPAVALGLALITLGGLTLILRRRVATVR